MEAIIFVGIQGAGKSSFYKERFFTTHVRLNLDMLRTRHRLSVLLNACLETRQPYVLDNTHPTAAERAPYIRAAASAGFRVVGYYFDCSLADCLRRNEARDAPRRVPARGVVGTWRRLQPPTNAEGFDTIYRVRIDERSGFAIEEDRDAV